jgi:hypothetical protein
MSEYLKNILSDVKSWILIGAILGFLSGHGVFNYLVRVEILAKGGFWEYYLAYIILFSVLGAGVGSLLFLLRTTLNSRSKS